MKSSDALWLPPRGDRIDLSSISGDLCAIPQIHYVLS